MRRLVDHALEHGVDWEYGGIYRDGVAGGEALILEKEFWQNAEALVGFLDAYQTFGEVRYFEAFENCWNFIRQHMIIPGVGEWRTLLDRQGSPIDPKIGNPWKVVYHSGRSLLESVNRLDVLGG
jgi:mannobiose 2-epimerase